MARLLTRFGYRMVQSSSVRAGLETVRREPSLALILLDLHLPEVSGFEALMVLKADPQTRDIPVVVVSASSDPKDEARARDLGAFDYVGHPITDARILAAVRRALGPQSMAT